MESSPTTILNFLLSLYKMIKERTIKPESACGMVEEDEYVEKYMGGRQYTTVAGGHSLSSVLRVVGHPRALIHLLCR